MQMQRGMVAERKRGNGDVRTGWVLVASLRAWLIVVWVVGEQREDYW